MEPLTPEQEATKAFPEYKRLYFDDSEFAGLKLGYAQGIRAERSRWEPLIKELEEAANALPDLYVYEKDNQGTYFLRNTKTQIVSERNSNGGHVEAMCKWLNSVYREGALDAAKAKTQEQQHEKAE